MKIADVIRCPSKIQPHHLQRLAIVATGLDPADGVGKSLGNGFPGVAPGMLGDEPEVPGRPVAGGSHLDPLERFT